MGNATHAGDRMVNLATAAIDDGGNNGRPKAEPQTPDMGMLVDIFKGGQGANRICYVTR